MKMKRIRNKILQIMVLQTMVLMCVMIFSTSIAYADRDFNWAGWYYVNGMYSVIGNIMDGSMTVPEAIETIVVPAHNAGYVSETELSILITYYPEAEQHLEVYGIIPSTPSTGTVTETPTETTPPAPAYTIEDCDMVKYATTNVNIRSDADANASLVGSITQNEQAHITGKTSNGWYRLEYNGMTGFSVAKYFSDVKVEEVAGVTDSSETASEPTSEVVSEVTSETVSEVTSEPTSENKSEPTGEVNSEDVSEDVSETTSESDTRTDIYEATPEKEEVTEDVTEEVSEEVSEDTPEAEKPAEKNVLPIILVIGACAVVVGGTVAVVILKRNSGKVK